MKHKFDSSPNSPAYLAEFSSCGPNSSTSSPNSPKIPLEFSTEFSKDTNDPNSPDPVLLAGAPIVMFINIYAGESPIRKTCNFDKPLNHILKVMDGCMHIFCLVKQQNTQN